MMSSHYQTKAPLSPELIEKIVKRCAPRVHLRCPAAAATAAAR